MIRQIIIFCSIFAIILPSITHAQIYKGSGYTIDLSGKNWDYDTSDLDGMETYSLGSRIIQVFPMNVDVYDVIVTGNKKNISSLFQIYANTIGSKDMRKEQSRKIQHGILHFALFSAEVQPDEKFYGAFCIVSNKNLKSSRMVNVLDMSRAIRQTEALRICSSLEPVYAKNSTNQ